MKNQPLPIVQSVCSSPAPSPQPSPSMKTTIPNSISQLLRSHARQVASVKTLSRRAVRLVPEVAFRGSAAALALFALCGFNPQALAASQTWNGGSVADGNWSDTANWVGGAAPGST